MESTGKYWIPVFNVLETEEKMNIVLVHPKYVKAIKGKKTDKKDSKWICDLFKHEPLSFLQRTFVNFENLVVIATSLSVCALPNAIDIKTQ